MQGRERRARALTETGDGGGSPNGIRSRFVVRKLRNESSHESIFLAVGPSANNRTASPSPQWKAHVKSGPRRSCDEHPRRVMSTA